MQNYSKKPTGMSFCGKNDVLLTIFVFAKRQKIAKMCIFVEKT